MQIAFFVAFVAVNILFFIIALRILGASKKNTSLPRIESRATVISKRSVRASGNSPRIYFMTFRFSTGDICEYKINEDAYSYFTEGDEGKITVRGTEFISFVI